MCFSVLDRVGTNLGTNLEKNFRQIRGSPHIKYAVRPFYKALAKRVGDVAATALTFMTVDVVIHQIGGYSINCALAYLLAPKFPTEIQEKIVVEACTFSYDVWQMVLWTSVAFPIMYVKYQRKKQGEEALLPISKEGT